MAVLKHIAIKNADYSAAVCYLKYQHDERHLKPLLDENGSMIPIIKIIKKNCEQPAPMLTASWGSTTFEITFNAQSRPFKQKKPP